MLKILEEIYALNSIEDSNGERRPLHSHTFKDQGLFIQEMFDLAKVKQSLEVGLAYGISTLWILEKHRQKQSAPKSHIVIEPFPWGNTALHNIKKEGLENFIEIKNELSDKVLTQLYLDKKNIQFAYVDTTKVFDVVLQDFYFIDKILDVNGIVIIDDCDTPGINKVVRFINTLPHYVIVGRHAKVKRGWKYSLLEKLLSFALNLIPFKSQVFPNLSLKTSSELNINYRCIAFKKIAVDERRWDWDKPL